MKESRAKWDIHGLGQQFFLNFVRLNIGLRYSNHAQGDAGFCCGMISSGCLFCVHECVKENILSSTDGLPCGRVVPSALLYLSTGPFPLSLPAEFSSIWKCSLVYRMKPCPWVTGGLEHIHSESFSCSFWSRCLKDVELLASWGRTQPRAVHPRVPRHPRSTNH